MSDELLPSLNTDNINNDRWIVVHPMIFIDTPPFAIVPTPLPQARARRPRPYNVSPYLATFGSQTASSSKLPTIFHKKHPFDSIDGTHDTSLFMHLWKWLLEGLLSRHQHKKNNEDRHKKHKVAMSVPLELGVATISDRNWLQVAVPWHTVDNIFIPVNMKEKFHWVLVVLCLNDCIIYVYDSIRSAVHDSFVKKEVKKFADLIPTYLATSDYLTNKGLASVDDPNFNNPFDIVHVNNLPQQNEDNVDCGVYMLTFAEYLSDRNGIPETPIDFELMRNRYAALLWDYGMRKIQEDAINDNEAPPKTRERFVDRDVENIAI